jgi:AraC family transcriptional regulator, regulatory protein of adaptative response / DNA-3-methyladenine glycosylase II
MQQISAVVKTGFYCQSTCTNPPPREEDSQRFRSAAEAEAAGLRACPRCRPYRTSVFAVDGAPELVCRAVRLILDGALDDASEDNLGRRLGVSGRHLRRLFLAHLGITPSGLAVSSRAHFARRLLDDTDLTFTNIAFAAGFGSVRQFNRVMRSVFGLAPRELREQRHRQDRLVADEGLLLRLPVNGTIDWDGTLELLAAASLPGIESVMGRTYRRTVIVQDSVGMLEVLPPEDETHVLVKLHLPHWGSLIHLVQRVRNLLGLDADPETAYSVLSTDPLIGPIVRERPGLRPVGAWDSFEAAVKAILGAPDDEKERERFGELCSEPEGVGGAFRPYELWSAFPSPKALAELLAEGCSLPERLATALRSLSVALSERSVTIDIDVPMHVRVRSFASLDGVVPSMTERFAWLAGSADALPDDESVRRVLGRLSNRSFARQYFDAAVEMWHPYAAFAYAHVAVSCASRLSVGVETRPGSAGGRRSLFDEPAWTVQPS